MCFRESWILFDNGSKTFGGLIQIAIPHRFRGLTEIFAVGWSLRPKRITAEEKSEAAQQDRRTLWPTPKAALPT